MNKVFIPFLAALALLLASCGGNNNDKKVYADNPTNQTLNFTIDGVSYSIPPKEHLLIDLADGTHTMTVKDAQETITFEKMENDKGALLNPANAQYVVWKTPYTDKPIEENRAYLNSFKDVVVNGTTYHGPFTVIEGYYNGNGNSFTWKFGLDEDFPESYNIHDSGSTSVNIMFGKLFRAEDFEAAYRESEEE